MMYRSAPKFFNFIENSISIEYISRQSSADNSKQNSSFPIFFCEESNQVLIDLNSIKFIEILSIFLDKDSNENFYSFLDLKISCDKNSWSDIKLSPNPYLEYGSFYLFSPARYLLLTSRLSQNLSVIKMQLMERSVESEENQVEHVRYGFFAGSEFFLTHSDGFFANCSLTLLEIAKSYPKTKSINALNSFHFFKDDYNSNPWPRFFSPLSLEDKENLMPDSFSIQNLAHSDYSKLNFQQSAHLLRSFFQPSAEVLSIVSALTEKYQMIFDETIALNYRGTDKHTEIKIWPPEDYWFELQPLIDANPNYRILIQTDQKQVRDYFVEKLGSRCFFFDELPVTEGDLVIHKILDTSKLTFGLYLLAMVIIMARCKYLITHTGNVAYWTLLYRGSWNNVKQFYV